MYRPRTKPIRQHMTEELTVCCFHGYTFKSTSRRQGPDSLEAAVPRAASRIVSMVRKLLEETSSAHVLLMPVLLGGDIMQPLPRRLHYPNRSEPRLTGTSIAW